MPSMHYLRRTARLGALAFAALLLPVSAAVAHHTTAMYDHTKKVSEEGKVIEFQWGNPHSFILVDVPTKDGPKRLTVECSHPRWLMQAGWNRNSLRPGDQVKVSGSPLRDGRPGLLLQDVMFPDGRKLEEYGSQSRRQRAAQAGSGQQ